MKMMMNRFDLGGCCLARYGTASPCFASKTDQIMSRYRPIAPKPVVQSVGGVVETVIKQKAPPAPPPPPLESSRVRTCNRSRKRSWDATTGGVGGGVGSSPSPRSQKRATRCRGFGSERSSSVALPASSSVRPHSDTSEDGISTLCEISDSAGTGSINFGLGPRTSLGYSTSSCTSFESSFAAQKNEGLLEKDAAFMERAAASACPNVNLPERRSQALISPARLSTSIMPAHQGSSPKQELVTLPLLPTTPFCKESSSANGILKSAFEEDCQSLPELSLSNRITGRSPCPGPGPGTVVDISVVDHLYSAASEPLILTDDSYSRQVIWYNPAYKRLLSLSATELGTPRPLATLALHNQPSTAILWGFQDRKSPPLPSKKGVIMPQAVRPVGSSVVVECITDTHLQEGMKIGMSAKDVEKELESKASPCLISDSQKRVRWVNSAYKQMVGQPECSWLETREKESNKVARIQGQVALVYNLRLPQGAAAFSCRVKIQWSNSNSNGNGNAGDKTSITVPCDVARINANGEETSSSCYAWHFDMQAALCL